MSSIFGTAAENQGYQLLTSLHTDISNVLMKLFCLLETDKYTKLPPKVWKTSLCLFPYELHVAICSSLTSLLTYNLRILVSPSNFFRYDDDAGGEEDKEGSKSPGAGAGEGGVPEPERYNDQPQEEVQVPETRIDVEVPKITTDLGKEMFFVKLPNFLSVECRSVATKIHVLSEFKRHYNCTISGQTFYRNYF